MGSSLGIYIHVPFCEKKCPYCNFYSVKCSEDLEEKYLERTLFEIEKWGKSLKRKVNTIYFGGGTPSLLSLEKILKILDSIKKNFNLDSPEITLEVNPADYSLLDFERLAYAGVNRISVGAQSLDEKGLKILGRRHSVEDILKTYSRIKLAKIDNISLDMIVGFPEQKKSDIDNFIDYVKENNIPHLSAYLLKVEPDTPYGKSNLNFLSDEVCSDFYMYISQKMKSLGYNHYEISNFSLPGMQSRHNMKYWNLDDYLGIGPSAHSLINKERFYYGGSVDEFIKTAEIKQEGAGGTPEEYAMLRLRLGSGLTNEGYKEKFGEDIPKEYFEKAKKFEELKLLEIHENKISLTLKGFLLSNKIISDLIF